MRSSKKKEGARPFRMQSGASLRHVGEERRVGGKEG